MKKWLVLLAGLCLLGALVLIPETLPGWDAPEQLPGSDGRRIRQELVKAVKLCRDDSSVDEREARLLEAGFSAVDTDEIHPDHLGNPEKLLEFANGEADSLSVFKVREDSLWHFYFFRDQGEDYFLSTRLSWEGAVISQEILPVYEMELAPWDIFYYRLYPKDDPHYIDYNQLRLTPVDRELYDLTLKYILSVGYQMVNLFLTDWQEGAWGELAFNDVFEYLYEIRTGTPFLWQELTFSTPTRTNIPARLFEDTLLPYFDISREELRALARYDAATGTYPWRPVHGNELTARKEPFREPQVVDASQNPDGTLTLTVQVYSPEVKTDRLFVHEVTVRPLAEGGFQYVGNRVTYVGEWGLPYNKARFSLDEGGAG